MLYVFMLSTIYVDEYDQKQANTYVVVCGVGDRCCQRLRSWYVVRFNFELKNWSPLKGKHKLTTIDYSLNHRTKSTMTNITLNTIVFHNKRFLKPTSVHNVFKLSLLFPKTLLPFSRTCFQAIFQYNLRSLNFLAWFKNYARTFTKTLHNVFWFCVVDCVCF